jgi:hypothetical protein
VAAQPARAILMTDSVPDVSEVWIR